GLREVVAERRELLEALLEVPSLRRELGEPRLLLVVLLLRERVDLAHPFAPALEPLDLVGELVAVVAHGGRSSRGLQPPAPCLRLRFDASTVDLNGAQPRAGLRCLPPCFHFRCAETAPLV